MIQPPAAHSWPWWAYDLAWSTLQRDNDRRWRAGQELWSTIQPAHYAFLIDRACSPMAPAATPTG